MSSADATPQTVAEIATTQTKLDRTTLIGTFGSASAPGAIIRLRNGETARVMVGDTLDGQTVRAIDDSRVMLSRAGRQTVLSLPQS